MLLLAHYNFIKIKTKKKGVEKEMFYKKLIETLKNTINNLEKENNDLKMKVEQRDLMLRNYQNDYEILLNNATELRIKITDLENNIELLTNNLSQENKELVRPLNQN